MRRKTAVSLLLIMFINIFYGMYGTGFSNADTLSPSIDEITIQEVLTIEGKGSTPKVSYRIIFNGFRLKGIEDIRVRKLKDGVTELKNLTDTRVVKTLSASNFTFVDNDAIYTVEKSQGQSLQTILGATGDLYFGIVKDNKEYFNIDDIKKFTIPEENIITVNKINNNDYPEWPISIIKASGNKIILEGSNFDLLLEDPSVLDTRTDPPREKRFSLYLQGEGSATDISSYRVLSKTEIEIDMGNVGISGSNLTIMFEKKKVENVAVQYILRNAINIVDKLDLGEVDISPLEGTQGTVLRIKVKDPKKDQELVKSGMKVYIDGVVANKNIENGKEGKFNYISYDPNSGDEIVRTGIEVIVPKLAVAGSKQIRIQYESQNNHSVYIHPEEFEYSLASGTRLGVININPEEGSTNKINEITTIDTRNVLTLHNIPGLSNEDNIKINKISNAGDLHYSLFKNDIVLDSYYIQYKILDGENKPTNHYIERKVSLFIGLPGKVTSIPWIDENKDKASVTLKDIETTEISGKTGLVGDSGRYTVRLRTETIYFELKEDGKIDEKYFVVEEAPHAGDKIVEYTFEPDINTPVMDKIIPNTGPYNKEIVATITGQNFRVEASDGKRYYPTIVIGSDMIAGDNKYKVISRDEQGMYYYFSDQSNGRNHDGSTPEKKRLTAESYFEFKVLDSAGNEVDGQARKSGTQIKFVIPAADDGIRYNGAADVFVYNPSSTGGQGGWSSKKNLFEYLTPGDGVLLPVIDSVTPGRVAVDKQEEVTIKGKNFKPGATVTIDGEAVTNPQIDVVKNTIKFKAPKGRPGKTYIQVINPDGGMATERFEYILTYSQPVIEKIIPNEGPKGTLVIIKGKNFYPADKDGETDLRKIGTKVLIDGKDINTLFKANGTEKWEYADLEGEIPSFKHPYNKDEDGNDIELFDADGIKPLKSYGNHVVVVDNETIYFIVPDAKAGDDFFLNEWLKLEVVNPDLGKTAVQRGFKIIDAGDYPTINEIVPNLGDYRGGNIVEIKGENLKDGVKVYFGALEAQVYKRSGRKTIWAYVPSYTHEMDGRNKVMVPVTVQNPDKGTNTKYNGYTYVNPGYTPQITGVDPNIGNTSGGDRIFIKGINFRAKNFGGTQTEKLEGLPSIFIGGKKVNPEHITFVLPLKDPYKEEEVSDLIIVEKTPENASAGKVDITVINYDGATATLKGGFEYRFKQPSITTVLPNQGTVQGGSEITLTGKDFVENGLYVTVGEESAKKDTLSGQAIVKVGDVVVYYDAYASGENISLYYKDYQGESLPIAIDGTKKTDSKINLADDEFKIITALWQDLPDRQDLANENIKIEIKNEELIVTRRLAIIKRVEGEERITLLTPPGTSVGEKTLTVYNSDGKKASSKFIYTNPYRIPTITKITPATSIDVTEIGGEVYDPAKRIDVVVATPPGGSPIIIEGENFRSGVKVFIGDKPAEIKSKSANDKELVVIVPPAATGTVERYIRILIVNEDGGQAYADIVPKGQSRNPYYFKYILEGSTPKIDSISPEIGPSTGGTKVTVKGSGFKDEDSFGKKKTVTVYVGGRPISASNVRIIDYQTVEITMPQGNVGKQTIEIVNYDNGRAIAKDIFTYISQPKIISANPAKIFTNDTETEVVISGEMFQNGSRVIIGGQLVREKDVKAGQTIMGKGIYGVDSNGRNVEMAIVGGVEAASVNFEFENILKVKFKEATNLEKTDIIVINPDGGISNPYDKFNYQIPVPDKPLVLEAIAGYESTVKLIWSESGDEILNRADRYEIYGKKTGDKQYTFIGDTRQAEFLVKSLEPNTNYTFIVRAMNKYGSALEFAEARVRTLSKTEDDKLKDKEGQMDKEKEKLAKEGKEEVINGTLIKTIGTKQIPIAVTPYVIDLSLAKYKNNNKITIAIPVSLIQSLNRKITIKDQDLSFTFLPSDFYTREVGQIQAKDMDDAHVLITLEKLSGMRAEGINSSLLWTQRRASQIYELSFGLQAGRNTVPIYRMLDPATLTINHNKINYPLANSNSLFIGKYQAAKDVFNKIATGNTIKIQDPGVYMLLSDR